MQDKVTDRVKGLFTESEDKKVAQMYSRDLINLAISSLAQTDNPKVRKAIAIGTTAWTVFEAGKGLYSLYKRNAPMPLTYNIKITEADPIFEVVEDWFMDALPDEEQRSVVAHSAVKKGDRVMKKRGRARGLAMDSVFDRHEPSSEKDRVVIDYSFDGTIVQNITIAGHEVQVFTTIPEKAVTFSVDGGRSTNMGRTKTLTLVCKTVKARNDVLQEIENQSQHLLQSQPRMFLSSRWGDVRKRAEIQPRSLNSVILKEGQMGRIMTHLNTFLDNKEAYAKADIPFRTGILLHGAPGSGKSSTALAIANELKMNVYIISISSLVSDEALNDCFTNIPANSIIVLEDIDITSAVRERSENDDDDEKGVTMSGMLNVLDGFQSPPGVITIMTTNRIEVLDEAIKRPGRVDLTEELSCLDDFQLRGMCQYFMKTVPDNLPYITPEDGISSAQVMGVMRKHLPDFADAAGDLVEFLLEEKGKNLEKSLTTED